MKNLVLAASLVLAFGVAAATHGTTHDTTGDNGANRATVALTTAASARGALRLAAVGDDSTCKIGCWASRGEPDDHAVA